MDNAQLNVQIKEEPLDEDYAEQQGVEKIQANYEDFAMPDNVVIKTEMNDDDDVLNAPFEIVDENAEVITVNFRNTSDDESPPYRLLGQDARGLKRDQQTQRIYQDQQTKKAPPLTLKQLQQTQITPQLQPDNPQPETSCEPTESIKQCPLCLKQFTNPNYYNVHMEFRYCVTNNWNLCCAICKARFPTKPDLEAHVELHRTNQLFCAKQCGMHFKTYEEAVNHEHIVHSVRKIICNVCEVRFTHSAGLVNHMNSNHKSLPRFTCSHCREWCISEQELEEHWRKRSEDCGKLMRMAGHILGTAPQKKVLRPQPRVIQNPKILVTRKITTKAKPKPEPMLTEAEIKTEIITEDTVPVREEPVDVKECLSSEPTTVMVQVKTEIMDTSEETQTSTADGMKIDVDQTPLPFCAINLPKNLTIRPVPMTGMVSIPRNSLTTTTAGVAKPNVVTTAMPMTHKPFSSMHGPVKILRLGTNAKIVRFPVKVEPIRLSPAGVPLQQNAIQLLTPKSEPIDTPPIKVIKLEQLTDNAHTTSGDRSPVIGGPKMPPNALTKSNGVPVRQKPYKIETLNMEPTTDSDEPMFTVELMKPTTLDEKAPLLSKLKVPCSSLQAHLDEKELRRMISDAAERAIDEARLRCVLPTENASAVSTSPKSTSSASSFDDAAVEPITLYSASANVKSINHEIVLALNALDDSTILQKDKLKELVANAAEIALREAQRKYSLSRTQMGFLDHWPERRKIVEKIVGDIKKAEMGIPSYKWNELTSAKRLDKIRPSNEDSQDSLPVKSRKVSPSVAGKLAKLRKQLPNDRNGFICPQCLQLYSAKQSLRTHLVKAHGMSQTEVNQIMMLLNPLLCPTSEKSPHANDDHDKPIVKAVVSTETPCVTQPNEQHEVEKPKMIKYKYECPKCGRQYSTRSTLSDHILGNCSREPQYPCKICSKRFFSSGTLNCHMTIHTGELPHKCDYCDKRFRTRGQVTVHHRTHTGERPFVCQVCNHSFTHRETLISHLSRHIGMKRYKCYGCDKHFSCISGLRTHRSIRPDTCGRVKFNSRAVGPRVRVIRGNVVFEPQPDINPYLRTEDPSEVLAEIQNQQKN